MSAIPSPAMELAGGPAPWGERAYQGVLTFALALLGVFVPYSTAGTAIALAILFTLCLAAPKRVLASGFWRDPFFAVGLTLLAYIALRTFVGEGFTMASLHAVNHYQELLILPVLWAVFTTARRPQAFGVGLACGIAYLAGMYWIFGSGYHDTFGLKLLMHRISAGFIIAIAAYVLFEHARMGRIPRWLGFGGAAALALTVFMAIDGRTGHIVLLFLMACAAFRAAPRRARTLTTVAVVAAAVGFAALSPTVRHRAAETIQGTEAAEQGRPMDTSSTSIRIEILRNAAAVARQHWAVGTGWDHYPGAIAAEAQRRHADPKAVRGALSVNPHNEYLLQLAAGGLPSLLLFLGWLACPVWLAISRGGRHNPWAGTVACVSLAFAIGCLFNSLLLDFIEAHFYVALVAWLLARGREA